MLFMHIKTNVIYEARYCVRGEDYCMLSIDDYYSALHFLLYNPDKTAEFENKYVHDFTNEFVLIGIV